MNTLARLIVLLITFTFTFSESVDILEVSLKKGRLKGKYWKTRKGRLFIGFTGIPYAKPPIGDLRFKAPIPVSSWEGILDATKSHSPCPQISIYLPQFPILGDEDCLYLNVYTLRISNSTSELLPVMFYIHGGSFIMGSAKPEWLGPEILLDKNIVLVTTNYRLGALGFLSTGDSTVPGNNGLKDQNLALKWVKDNIANFGGDPESITVFGNSAGAANTHFHIFSPLSRGLIKRAIIQSGIATSNYAMASSKEAHANAKKLGKFLNCSSTSIAELINCLRNVEVKEIVAKEAKFCSWDNDTTIPFRPVIEDSDKNAFLSQNLIEILKSGNAADIPLMIGIAAQEAGYKSADLNSKPELLKKLDKYFDLIIPPSFGINVDKKKVSKLIRKFYFSDSKIDSTTLSGISDMYTDGWFLFNHDVAVRLHKRYSSKPIYQYLFDYRGSTSYSTLFDSSDHDYGVCHTDELLHLFTLGMTFPKYEPTESDLKMSEVLTALWTNFAKTGNPNFIQARDPSVTAWNPIQTDALEYYHIKSYAIMKMEKKLHLNRTEFWRGLPTGKLEL